MTSPPERDRDGADDAKTRVLSKLFHTAAANRLENRFDVT
jgi:hypothetical protein